MTVKRFDAGSWRESPWSRRRFDLSQFAVERVVVSEICVRVQREGDSALREVLIARIAPVSRELILCNIAEKALGLPKSY